MKVKSGRICISEYIQEKIGSFFLPEKQRNISTVKKYRVEAIGDPYLRSDGKTINPPDCKIGDIILCKQQHITSKWKDYWFPPFEDVIGVM